MTHRVSKNKQCLKTNSAQRTLHSLGYEIILFCSCLLNSLLVIRKYIILELRDATRPSFQILRMAQRLYPPPIVELFPISKQSQHGCKRWALYTVTCNHVGISQGLDLIQFILSNKQEIDFCTQDIDHCTHHMFLTAVLCQSTSDSQR